MIISTTVELKVRTKKLAEILLKIKNRIKDILLFIGVSIIIIINFGQDPAPWPLNSLHFKLSKFTDPLGLNVSGRYFSATKIEFVVGVYKVVTEKGQVGFFDLISYDDYHSDLAFLRDSLMQQKMGGEKSSATILADSYGEKLCSKHEEAKSIEIFRAKRQPLSPDQARKGYNSTSSTLLNDIELLSIHTCKRANT